MPRLLSTLQDSPSRSSVVDRGLTRNLALAAVLAAFLALWLGGLGTRPLAAPDEARYGEIAAEMVASGNWTTPRLNDLKYFEKPPLQAWSTATAYEVVGVNEAATRLFPALAGLLAVVATGFFARRLAGIDAGLAAAAVLASSLLAYGSAHYVTLDMGVTAFLAVAVFAFAIAQHDESSESARTRWMLLAWAMAALAVLAKGLIGVVLPGLAVVAYALVDRQWTMFRRLRFGLGIPLFLAIAAPWFVVVSMRNPEFARFFFIEEHFVRFAGTAHHRAGAWWYFLPVIIVGLLPWTPLLPKAMREAWRAKSGRAFSPLRFLVVWSVVVVAFFSISHSKLPPYVLPAWPALAAIVGVSVVRVTRGRLNAVIATAAGTGIAIAVLALAALPKLAPAWIPASLMSRAGPGLALAGLVLLIASVLASVLARRGRRLGAVLVIALGGVGLARGAFDAFAVVTPAISSAAVVRDLARNVDADTPVYAIRHLDQSEPFYLGRPITLVEDAGEVAPGARWEPDRFVPDVATFEHRWRDAPHAAALMLPADYGRFLADGLCMSVVAQDLRRVAVVKPTNPAACADFVAH